MVEQVLWLSAVGAFLALDHSLLGQFMISQPLVVGAIFGYMLGDIPTGLFVGALIQLIWLGVIPVGAYIPSDHTVTGGITVALTGMLTHQQGFAFGPSIVFALMIAIPAGTLAGKLDIVLRHSVNDRLARRAEAVAENGRVPVLGWYHGLALIPPYLKNFLIYALWLGPVAVGALHLFMLLPASLVSGLGVVFWGLPALSFAVLFELATRDRFHWWTVGAFVLGWLALLLWPGGGWWIFSLAVVGAGVLTWWRGEK